MAQGEGEDSLNELFEEERETECPHLSRSHGLG